MSHKLLRLNETIPEMYEMENLQNAVELILLILPVYDIPSNTQPALLQILQMQFLSFFFKLSC